LDKFYKFFPKVIVNKLHTPLLRKAPSLAHKYTTRTEVTECGKHSSLPWYGIIYGCKKFYGTRSCS